MSLPIIYDYRRVVGNRMVKLEYRSHKNFTGRFGGGWQWKVGMQFTTLNHIIFSLLFFTVTIKKLERSG